MRFFLARIFQICILLVIAAMIWAGFYLYNKGFSRSWRNRVMEEFRDNGIEVTVRRLTLDPFRGLIGKDIVIYESQDRDLVVARINHVALDINFANLARGESFLSAIDLRDTSMSIPVDPKDDDAPNLVIDRLRARVLFPPNTIRISQAECEAYGLTLKVVGNLLVPQDYRPETPPESTSRPLIGDLIEILENTQFTPGEAEIDIEFNADISNLENMRIEKAELRFGPIQHEKIELERLTAEVELNRGLLSILDFEMLDAIGKLRAGGYFQIKSGAGRFKVSSNLALQPIIDQISADRPLAELTFFSEPEIEAEIAIDPGGDGPAEVSILGNIRAEKFAVRSVVFDRFETDFSWEPDRLLVRNLKVVHRSGEVTGQVLKLEDNFQFRFESSLNPKDVTPLLDRNLIEFFKKWEFSETPLISIQGEGPRPDMNVIRATGSAKLGRASYQGTSVVSATSDFIIEDKKTFYRDFVVQREEGTATGSIVYDFGNGEVWFENVEAKLNPTEVIRWIKPGYIKYFLPYRFKATPDVTLGGMVRFRGDKKVDLTVKMNSSIPLDYTFIGKELSFTKAMGTLRFTKDELKLQNIRAQLFEGEVSLDGSLSLDPSRPSMQGLIKANGVNFEKLSKLYFDYDDSEGQLFGEFDFANSGMDPRTMRGRGRAEVIKGDIFAIPFLGPFSTILNTIVPGMGYTKADKASATFTMQDGVISTENFLVEGQGFGMIGEGEIFFLDDRVDFDIRVNAKGVPGVLLFPVSKLFEYTSKGSLRDAEWQPKLLTR